MGEHRNPTAPRPWRGRLLVLAGILAVAFTLRTAVTAVPPVVESIGRDLLLPSWLVGVIGMLPTALFAIAGLATPALMRRASPEAIAVGAMALAGLGQAVRAAAGDTWLFIAGTVVALAGMGAGNIVLPPLVKKHFTDRPGVVTALYVTVISVGTAIPPAVAVPVAEAAGWRFSLGSWALVNAVAVLPWLSIWPARGKRPAGGERGPGAAAPAGRVPDPAGSAPIRVWRSRRAWALAFLFGCTSLMTYTMFAWIPRIALEAGLSPEEAGLQLALFSAPGLPLSLAVPLVATRLRTPWPIVVFGVACFSAGFGGLWFAPAAAPALWSVLTGFGPATFPLALLLVNLRTRSQRVSGALSGFAQGVGYAVACLGPVVAGALRDATGTWTASFAFLAAVLAVLAVAGWHASRPGAVDDDGGVLAAR
ncbi:MFS transporter [Sinomonas halotolerans]|uniref:MFS transporter n=1 Tax=Sinomonas halotolerans TaxID=1644133 RepID=A0ABU9WWN0_9MICC